VNANKIAQVTAVFWVLKILATTLGETAGDLLSMTLDVGYLASSAILVAIFAGCVGAQLRARRFHPPLFWAVILASSMAGTTISDLLDRTVGLGYLTGSSLLLGTLLVILATWRWVEGTLSVSQVRTPRAERFYWTAILVSNTLGTALGDFLADDSGLGFAGGAALIGGALAVILALSLTTRVSRVGLFWVAFVLTRPFGATFGDLLTKARGDGGLGLGTIGASIVLGGLLLATLLAATARHRRDQREADALPEAG